jgi:quercetin dioxygenase-like cupin family protein
MSTKPQTKTQSGYTADKQVFNAAGVLLQFLASPGEIGDAICLIRGTMPSGVVVPLHSHAEPEILYVLEGSLEVFRSNRRINGWTTADVGDVLTIPGSVKHALRNSSSLPVTVALVTKSELYKFFRKLAKPFDPNERQTPPMREAIQELVAVAAEYGYWLASAEENAAIGLSTV